MKDRCNPDDVARMGTRRIGGHVEVRTLRPIAEVLADSDYFVGIAARFQTGDLAYIVRYGNDAFEWVVEFTHDVMVDIDRGRVRLFPTTEIVRSGREPESGWVVASGEDGFVVRHHGRTVERFPDEGRARAYVADRMGATALTAA